MPRDSFASANSRSPTPSQGAEGTDLHTVANQIEGLLDNDGHYNPNPGRPSRAHPDHDSESVAEARDTGRDDRGRFKSASSDESDEPESRHNNVEDVAADGDDRYSETVEDDGDTESELATSDDQEAIENSTSTEDSIQTLTELAEALETPLEDFKAAIKHSFKASGEDVTVTLDELEKGYQKDADYRRNTAKLADDRRAVEAETRNRMQAFERHNHLLAAQLSTAEQVIAAELNNPQFATLREQDPAEWTARREEIGQRLGALRQARENAAASYDQFQQQHIAQLRASEERRLLDAIPDFGKTHRETAKQLMTEMGYSESEISQVYDHRMVKGALELAALRKEVAELRELKKSASDTVKRVKKEVPKLTKPGKMRSGGKGLARDNVAKLRQRAAKSGSVEDAAKVIEQFM